MPGKAIWNRDIDKLASIDILEKVSEKTGTYIDDSRKTLLSSFEGWIYEKHNPYGNTMWINPIGIYHRYRKNYGLQYCPQCLATDDDPYFRTTWRLAFITICDKHRRLLLDRCPYCGAPISFHRDEIGQRNKYLPESIVSCFQCKKDLSKAPRKVYKRATIQDIKNHEFLIKNINSRWIDFNSTPVYCLSFFLVLHQIMRLLNSNRKLNPLKINLIKKTGIDGELFKGKRDIEFLTPYERLILIRLAFSLLDDWPERFIISIKRLGLSSSDLLKDFENAPYWYFKIVQDNFYFPSYQPAEEEIKSALRYMHGRLIPFSIMNVSSFFNDTKQNVFRKRKTFKLVDGRAFYKKLSCCENDLSSVVSIK